MSATPPKQARLYNAIVQSVPKPQDVLSDILASRRFRFSVRWFRPPEESQSAGAECRVFSVFVFCGLQIAVANHLGTRGVHGRTDADNFFGFS